MKILTRHILLAALLLRALMPLGWMPGSAQLGQSAWIICTADGQVQHGAPGKNDSAQQHQPCAFAAAHALATPDAHGFTAPLRQVAAIDAGTVSGGVRTAVRFAPQSPRAPPAFS